MRRSLITLLALTLASANLLAQSSPTLNTGGTPASTPAIVATYPWTALGIVIPVQLIKNVDAKKAKKGDELVAKATQYLRTNAGLALVPKETRFFGRITEVQARNKQQIASQMAITFDHATLKNGESIQIAVTIQAIVASPNRNTDIATSADASPSDYPGAQSGSHQGQMEGPVPATTIPPTAAGSPQTGTQGHPRIDGNTQGVVGIADLKLTAAADAAQGSVLSSEKNNVRLDEGTLLLLRVNR